MDHSAWESVCFVGRLYACSTLQLYLWDGKAAKMINCKVLHIQCSYAHEWWCVGKLSAAKLISINNLVFWNHGMVRPFRIISKMQFSYRLVRSWINQKKIKDAISSMDHIRRWLYETNLTIGVHFKKYLHSYQYFWPNPNPLNVIVDKNDEYWPNIEHTAKLLARLLNRLAPLTKLLTMTHLKQLTDTSTVWTY